ncbi:MAG: hypothetical protein IJL34_03015 [Treponema sp.]|jgi:hypothetical protein|nr:hypothetical protein [Treponema sp.]
MAELEMRAYPIGMLSGLLRTNGKQATDRKLAAYGYGFTSAGTGTKRVYTITALPDALQRFKFFCVFSLGFDPNTDFRKLRDFVFYLMGDDDFNWRPAEMMEEYLRNEKRGISRQTIGKYLQHFESLCLFVRTDDYVYYRVKKNYGVQEHEIITKEEYCQAWSYYHEWRNAHPEEDSRPAFTSMYNRFGGVPRKQGRVDRGAPWNRETINTLFDLASQSILEEVSG